MAVTKLEYEIFSEACKQAMEMEMERLTEEADMTRKSFHLLDEAEMVILRRSFLLLPDDWQSALKLYYADGLDYDEITSFIDLENPQGVILYARQRLALCFEEEDIAEEDLCKLCAEIVKEEEAEPAALDNVKIVYSSKFKQNMTNLFGAKWTSSPVVKHAKRAAAVVIVVTAIGLTTVVSVDGLHPQFFDWIASVFDHVVSLRYHKGADSLAETDFSQLEAVKPSYIPDGFKFVEAENTLLRVLLIYKNDQGKEITITSKFMLDNEGRGYSAGNYQTIVIEGKSYMYLYRNGMHTVVTEFENFYCTIDCETTKEDAIKIANSLKS